MYYLDRFYARSIVGLYTQKVAALCNSSSIQGKLMRAGFEMFIDK